jgi:hypothetical protein
MSWSKTLERGGMHFTDKALCKEEETGERRRGTWEEGRRGEERRGEGTDRVILLRNAQEKSFNDSTHHHSWWDSFLRRELEDQSCQSFGERTLDLRETLLLLLSPWRRVESGIHEISHSTLKKTLNRDSCESLTKIFSFQLTDSERDKRGVEEGTEERGREVRKGGAEVGSGKGGEEERGREVTKAKSIAKEMETKPTSTVLKSASLVSTESETETEEGEEKP